MIRHAVLALTAGALLTACSPADLLALAPPSSSDTRQDVTRVIDGDTFVTPEGTIRVLVVDSCEKGTDGGARATADAHRLLDGKRVKLDAEPGHDRDRYDRLLRYVTLPDGRDYAETMLAEDHSAVYAKRSDASEARTAAGRAADLDGRRC